MSFASFTLDWKSQAFAPPMLRSAADMDKEWNDIVFTDKSLFYLQHHDGPIRVWRHRGEKLLNCCVRHRYIGPTPVEWFGGGIGFHCRTPLLRIAGTLNSQCYISEVLEPMVLPYI
ncbi:transposable element Tc3 transposase [Trichonephila clavipes]|nr:transposable element Tc3 transposase [Trichonephila clavipes]